ncbi:MAG: hypothetical protein MJ118_05405 [Clostridia bacterium]|nr:hypothetical protein [Clostridia bacterium]
MKQGRQFSIVILWILLLAIAVWFGYNVYSSLTEPLTTTNAVEYEAGAGCYATGFVVRDESVIHSPYGITVITASEGSRIAKDGSVATGYLTDGAQQRQNRIAELRKQIEQLSYAGRYSSNAADVAALDAQISSDLQALSRCVCRRDMNSAEALSPELKGLILCRTTDESDADKLTQQLNGLHEELDRLQAQAASDTRAVTVSSSGYFSGAVDGFETVLTPEILEKMTVSEYNALSAEEIDSDAIGKLIRGDTWYFVTAVPASEAESVSEGDSVQLTFARDFYEPVTMKVIRISDSTDGYRLLVLSGNTYMQNVTLLRQQSADLVFASYSGLRVPKDAVRVTEDGRVGVYVREGAVAKWKSIRLLYDNGESYVAALDKSSTSNLWPGDEIIVHAKNLYEGKVLG